VNSNFSTYLTNSLVWVESGLNAKGDYMEPSTPQDEGPLAKACISHSTRKPPTELTVERLSSDIRSITNQAESSMSPPARR
jgi:hypothetical protein